MKTKLTKLCTILLAILMLMSGCASSSTGESSSTPVDTLEYAPDMWVIDSVDGSGKLYLFGSIHYADETAFPLPEYITDAYEESDYIAVECNTLAFQQLSEEEVLQYYAPLIYTDGTTIKDHIAPDVYEKAKALLTENGMYNSTLDYYHPSMWSSLITSIYTADSKCKPEYGIDVYFMTKAYEDNKEILEIENIAYQLTMELEYPDDMLSFTLSQLFTENVDETYDQAMTQLFTAWKTGSIEEYSKELDAQNAETLTEEELKLTNEHTRLSLTNRNYTMADAAIEYINEGKDVFYIVGAMHMYGEEGLISLLTKEGYDVKPVK